MSVSYDSGTDLLTISTDMLFANNTYTPTLTGVTNVAGTTAYASQYLRIGSTVTVSGKLDVDPTLTVLTQVGISLPIASNISSPEQIAGTAFSPDIVSLGGAILGDATNNRAELNYVTTSLANQSLYFTFTYRIV